MQVYLQQKKKQKKKQVDGTPYRGHGFVSLRFGGWEVVMRMGTQQQYNNQDRCVNEFDPPRTWTLSCSVLCTT